MNKTQKIIKNILLFLVVFLAINYLMQSYQNDEEPSIDQGNFIFQTTKNEYSRTKIVTVEIKNHTNQEITIPNECPNEPFVVTRYENNDWVIKESTPTLNCEKATDIIIQPGQEHKIAYNSWNNALFSEMGRFRIEFTTKFNGEEKTFTTNEFTIKKEGLFTQLWQGIFYKPIYNGLIFLTAILPKHDLGFAIIILTLIIRTILLIPSQKAMKAQKRMQEIQPRLEKIKEKYKGDQQKIATETMAVWKETKANPLGSCLPMLLQFPFLIAIFYVVKSGLNPDNTYLLYSQYEDFTISNINVNFLGILDLTKLNIYVLPLIVGGLQFIQMKLITSKKTAKDKDSKKEKKNEMAMVSGMMTYMMPIMIAVFTASLPAGVGIYWGTSTLYGIIQQLFVNKDSSDPERSRDEPTVKVIKPKN